MARQPRSEITRRNIINAAVDLFDEVGYASTNLGDIITRVDVTKGALYHHFDSKESLAVAIIEEAVRKMFAAYKLSSASSPALETLIQGTLVAAELASTDKLARTGGHLLVLFAKFNELAAGHYRSWIAETVDQIQKAQVEGDVRADLDPDSVGHFVVGALLGVHVFSTCLEDGSDIVTRVLKAWELLLPTLVPEASVPFFGQFIARQASRHLNASAT
ncbi:ScbR family autoregulator-binding transcription factor [Mycobacterium deserti]|uniref:TetR/AcrR family transcriptional regulator n=1 Tax=Mycobacterium deserti TaxID=2978347 RepID=A0ABT2MD01_9MYCO|nr:ScbR family autoregulator-binding transcription factor [Mycobacterium deserti]MCT7660152.1 TetR/AcrR family transcriptional regulator [Mycobacterium deserti]